MEIQNNISLARYTTFGIGGVADKFFVAKSSEDLEKILKYVHENSVSYFVIGGGSNLLISDDGFRGLVIKNSAAGHHFYDDYVLVESGASLAFIASLCLKHGKGGLEFASGIPGTIGGALVGNAGAYGEAIGERLISARVFVNGEIREWQQKDFSFEYRGSILKKNPKIIILSAKISLKPTPDPNFQERIREDNKRRSLYYRGRNAGSYFKNIPVENLPDSQKEILGEFIVHDKVVAAKLIDGLGLKGRQVGGAVLGPAHANVVNNISNATCLDVEALENIIIERVYDKYGVRLEPEVVKL